jgi:hypothetical protein
MRIKKLKFNKINFRIVYFYLIFPLIILIFLITTIQITQIMYLYCPTVMWSGDESNIIIVSKNPDFNYTRNEWPHEWGAVYYELPQGFWDPWKGEFAYFTEIANRKGVMLIHPGRETPSFIEQNVSLPKGKIFLFVTIADIVDDYDKFFNKTSQCTIADVFFKIKIISNNEENIIFTRVVNSKEGWVDVVLDISKFSGKNIIIKIESYAGGYDPWCGEFAAVDKFYVAKVV